VKRPESITIHLLANGKEIASKKVTEADKWAFDFGKLPSHENGKPIKYTVKEDAVPGYYMSYTFKEIQEELVFSVVNSTTPPSVVRTGDDSGFTAYLWTAMMSLMVLLGAGFLLVWRRRRENQK